MTNDLLVREIADRSAVTDLVLRLYELLDEQRFDELSSVYTDAAELDFPSGRMIGLEAVTAMARRRAERYDRMQHISTDIVVEIDGDTARIRTNHLSFHVHDAERPAAHFDAGLVHRFDAIRTADGWRLTHGEADVIWTGGNDQ
jgi:3-phenylpropionate/cinnamic acid dioxygenase small subunit